LTYRKDRPSKERVRPFKDNPKYLTDPVFLIGNGKSRKDFDLERLRGLGTIIGCNALYREFTPDLLVAIDAKMLRELLKAKYAERGQVLIPNNRTVAVPGAIKWNVKGYNTSGGFSMKLIAEVMQPTKCYMLGMDGYTGNLYDGTLNYATNTLHNFKGINTYYLKALQGIGETTFINVNEKDAWPKEVHDTGKYKFITYKEFECQIKFISDQQEKRSEIEK